MGVSSGGCGDDMGRIADGGVACDTEGCDDPSPGLYACQDVVDGSGRPVDDAFLDGLSDTFARKVLKQPGACPRAFSQVVEKLRLEDDDRCSGDARAGMIGRIVSERAQLLEESDVVRAVVGRQCGRRLPYELMFATGNIDADNPELPEGDLQVIAYDAPARAFNFYALQGQGEGAQWVFHGSSFDLIDPQRRRTSACASCHTDGGLVMREIDAPWVHWESPSVRTVGAGAVVDRFAELGARSTGAELSEVIKAGNARWNRDRAAALADPANTALHGGSTRALLEPLFCDTSINLQSAGTPSELGRPQPVASVPSSFFVDPAWSIGDAVPIDPERYAPALTAIGSRIEGLVGPRDTFFGLTYVERAAADTDYVQALLELGVVDEEFVLDVLSVDFTTPVYSSQRCGLLDQAPTFADLDSATDAPEDGPQPRGCCVGHASAGCEDPDVEVCVCDEDPYCCESAWDQGCVNAVIDGGCGTCVGLERARGLGGAADPARARPTPQSLRSGYYAALEGVGGSAAAQLRGALARSEQIAEHRARAARFVRACVDRATTRDPEGFVLDLLEVSAWRRREAMAATELLDRPGVVATDDLEPPMGLGLDPITCAAVSG